PADPDQRHHGQQRHRTRPGGGSARSPHPGGPGRRLPRTAVTAEAILRARKTPCRRDPGGVRMNLELLRTFLAVHRAGSFTRAAAALGVSQPTVTAQIRTLEKELGRQLFVRHQGGVSPTGPADQLARRVAPHLDGLAAVVETEVRRRPLSEQPVHLGGPAELLAARVLPALAPLVDRGLRLRVVPGLPEPLLDGLLAGRHDLVLCTVPPRRRGVSATPLVDEEF